MNKTLSPSELIITPQGRIAHLNLNPEELADCVITVGDPDRVSIVSRYFDKIEVKVQNREFVTHTGSFNGKRLTVISTGIGTSNIDVVLNELDALVNIDLVRREIKSQLKSLKIIRLGTAGAIHPSLEIGGYALSTHAVGLDGLMQYYKHPSTAQETRIFQAVTSHFGEQQLPVAPYVVTADENLVKQFTPVTTAQGITLTCPGFYGPQNRILRADITCPNFLEKWQELELSQLPVINFEMETAAIFGLGTLLGHQCASISFIIANRIKHTFCADPAKLIEQFVLNMLQQIVQL